MVGTDDVDGVFHIIKSRITRLEGHPVIVHQDGAPPHSGLSNVEIIAQVCLIYGRNIQVV